MKRAALEIQNVVLVSYDSVRADVAYSGRLPGLEALRRRGATFASCVASAPYTPVSHATVMTGLQPYHHGIRHLFRESLDPACQTLATRLGARGFDTSAVVSCPGLHRWYQIGRGFRRYDDEIPRLPDGTDPLETVDVKLRGRAMKRAPLAVERSRAMLEDTPPGSFLHFLHFFDAHWPYEPPQAHDPAAHNPYEGEVAFLDHHFSTWLSWMESTGRLDKTLIVLFGDHGEDLNGWYPDDRGGEALGHPEEMGHGCLLYDNTIRVPLVFSHPQLEPRTIGEQVRLVDIVPTVLELLGLPAEPELDGVSLASAVLGEGAPPELPAYSETHYPREQAAATGDYDWTRNKKSVRIGNRWKVIFHVDSDLVEVYDLERDPHERRDLLTGGGEP
jgi:arylsulfatase A-like enzyme